MSSLIAGMIDEVIRGGLALPLKSRGFRKLRRTFIKPMSDLTHVLNVQGHPWNRGEEGSFMVNLGIFLPPVHEFYHGPVPRFPHIYDCEIRVRVSDLIYGRELWWPVGPNTDLEVLTGEVSEAVLGLGLAFLRRLRNLREVLYALEEGLVDAGGGTVRRLWTSALLHYHLGNVVQTRRLLRRSLLETEGRPGHDYALNVCQRLGIEV